MNLPLAIEDTKKALSRARAARTTLCELNNSPEHRGYVVALEAVIAALVVELASLRYAVRHEVRA